MPSYFSSFPRFLVLPSPGPIVPIETIESKSIPPSYTLIFHSTVNTASPPPIPPDSAPSTPMLKPGLSDPACSAVCAAGFYCGAGATTPTESVCGGSGLYCPVGSSTPSKVLVGYYGVHAGVEAGLQVNIADARDAGSMLHFASTHANVVWRGSRRTGARPPQACVGI